MSSWTSTRLWPLLLQLEKAMYHKDPTQPKISVNYKLTDLPCSSDDKESACNIGDPGLITGSERSSGEGNGNSLQYSCLENPMDRGDWQGTVHGVIKSQTQLSDWTEPHVCACMHLCSLILPSFLLLWKNWFPECRESYFPVLSQKYHFSNFSLFWKLVFPL